MIKTPMKTINSVLTVSAFACLLLAGCGGGSSSAVPSEEVRSETTIKTWTGVYSNRDAGLSYAVDDIEMTLSSTDENKTFRMDGHRIVVSSDVCISVTSIDFANATFYENTPNGREDLSSPLPVMVQRLNSFSAASSAEFSYYGYEMSPKSSDATNESLAALLFEKYQASVSFDRTSEAPNVPSGLCFLTSDNEVAIELSVTATDADGASLLLFYEDL